MTTAATSLSFTGAVLDISVPLSSQIVVWPGDPPAQITRVMDVNHGDAATVSQLNLGSHTGTHVDALNHFKAGGSSLDQMDLSRYLGFARVVDVGEAQAISAEVLDAICEPEWFTGVLPLTRILFKTANSKTEWWHEAFNPDFVHVTLDGAQWLTQKGIQLIGIDYLSVESYHSQDAAVHHHLLDHDVYLVEGLNLSQIVSGRYELICLPLQIAGGDGAPARVVLRGLPQETLS